jgi:hypothetical protein
VRSHAKAAPAGPTSSRGSCLGSIHLVLAAICSLVLAALFAPAANAAPGTKSIVSSFGSNGSLGGQFSGLRGVAVNNSSGDVYVADQFNNRVQQFDSSGTFIRAWGFDVIQSGKPGDLGNEVFEVCTVAADCKAGPESFSPAPGGKFFYPEGIAIDQADGSVYVHEREFRRVQKFSSTGAFQLAFGKDVDTGGGTGAEVCIIAADCKAGVSGSLAGELGFTFAGPHLAVAPAGAPNAGNVLVADPGNRRVQEFTSSGAFVRAFGRDVISTGPGDSTTSEKQSIRIEATGGTFTISFAGDTTGSLPFDETEASVEAALNALSSIGGVGGSVTVTGGPGDEVGSSPYTITFGGTLTGEDVPQVFASEGELTGGAGEEDPEERKAFAATIKNGGGFEVCVAVDGDTCKAGVAGALLGEFASSQPSRVAVDTTGAIYTVESQGNNRVQKFTPQVGLPLLAPSVFAAAQLSGSPAPTDVAVDPSNDHVYVTKPVSSPSDRQVLEFTSTGTLQFTHGAGSGLTSANGLAVKAGDGPIYQSSESGGNRVYVLDAVALPTAEMDTPAVTAITTNSATLHGKVNPNGPPDISYRFEYSLNGTDWTPVSTPDTPLGSQVTAQSVSEPLSPGHFGLEPNTLYHVRVVATRPANPPVFSASTTFKTLAEAPIVETTGSPIRTATTAQLNGRFVAFNAPTNYHFEYGLTDSYGQSTPSQPGGSGGVYQLVTEEVEGLEPDTTYHYRLVADNGAPGSPVFGEDMAVTTRASDAPLSHGDFPGPVGSDRAWELVSQPDTSGNPVTAATAISDDGNRAVYRLSGGAPHSESASLLTQLFAERTPHGWETRGIYPPRAQANAPSFLEPIGERDLSELVTVNYSFTGTTPTAWRMFPDKPAEKVFETAFFNWAFVALASEDASRVAWVLNGPQDPDHPSLPWIPQLHDVSSGEPHLISLMPDGSVPDCGIVSPNPVIDVTQRQKWISEDGSFGFFETNGSSCGDSVQVYARDIEAETTSLMSGPILSGKSCTARFIKSTPDGAFFVTASRLVAEDTEPDTCETNRDVYRYDLKDDSLECATCVVAGLDTDILGVGYKEIGVSEDGSAVYFGTNNRLVPGATLSGIYRAEVATGELSYMGPIPAESPAGDAGINAKAISRDGSVYIFKSNEAALNALGGQDNDGTNQYYRYDSDDGSLVCVSCPQDASTPLASVKRGGFGNLIGSQQLGANTEPLDSEGNFLFVTPTSLVPADQNKSSDTPYTGSDAYEWRDGRILLISDGLTNWAQNSAGEVDGPEIAGFTPSGRDAFFTVPAQYTHDALDGFRRVYDARIGGGIDFPPPPPPCPLEVCQGTPKGAPEEAAPGTRVFSGPGDVSESPQRKRCGKGKRKVRRAGKTRCVKRQALRQRRANHNRRTVR